MLEAFDATWKSTKPTQDIIMVDHTKISKKEIRNYAIIGSGSI